MSKHSHQPISTGNLGICAVQSGTSCCLAHIPTSSLGASGVRQRETFTTADPPICGEAAEPRGEVDKSAWTSALSCTPYPFGKLHSPRQGAAISKSKAFAGEEGTDGSGRSFLLRQWSLAERSLGSQGMRFCDMEAGYRPLVGPWSLAQPAGAGKERDNGLLQLRNAARSPANA